jgi:hypothetical protein
MTALHFARTAAYMQGKKVLYIVIEMPKEQLYSRIDAAMTNIETRKFKFGKLTEAELSQWESQLTGIFEAVPEGRLYVHHVPGNCTLERLRQELDYIRVYEQEKVELMIVDDIDMMSSGGRNELEGQIENARGLKSIALEYQLPVWFITQLKTDSYNKDYLDVTDLGWAKEKAKIADQSLAIVKRTPENDAAYYYLQLLKYREGEQQGKRWEIYPLLEKAIMFSGDHATEIVSDKDMISNTKVESNKKLKSVSLPGDDLDDEGLVGGAYD